MSYISCYRLGILGSVGSQMEQYASLYGISKETNRELVFPESYKQLGYTHGGHAKIFEILDIPVRYEEDYFFKDFVDIKLDNSKQKDDRIYNLNPDVNYNIDENIFLYHWWYPKYNKDVLGWKWNEEKYLIAKNEYEKIKNQNKETVSIHVRRGDYTGQPDTYCQLGIENYFQKAVTNYFTPFSKYQYIIFSNEISWCKDNFNFIDNEDVVFIEPGEDLVDMILMSLCDHNIIANSTYSIWAAWRNYNKNKTVVCPKNYFKSNVFLQMTYNNDMINAAHAFNGKYYPNHWNNIENSIY